MSWVKRELSTLEIPPLKRFGQHFLIDTSVRDTLVQQAALTSSDTVLEIGPGLGFLTTAIAQYAGRVIAIEKDRTLATYLRKKFSNHSNVTIVQGDALETPIPDSSKIVSSPPYNISSKLILTILRSRFNSAMLLLQTEFARRLHAPAGSRDYGRLTVMFQCGGSLRLISQVPPSAFYPSPKVDSSIVRIEPLKDLPAIEDKAFFVDLVRVLFTQRRRRLKKVLINYLSQQYQEYINEISASIDVPEKRVFEMSSQELMHLSNQITHALAKQGARENSLGN
jgi:16S rRNA (adenine1518-N6/adenine1519-N6)-dimethyltransferase